MRESDHPTSLPMPADLSMPPPYALPISGNPSPRLSSSSGSRRSSHPRRQHLCQLCHCGHGASAGSQARHQQRRTCPSVIPFLIHRHHPQHVRTCACPQKVHLTCLVRDGQQRGCITCSICQYAYRPRLRICLSRAVCFAIHLLSLVSVIALVFGLAQLGSALDKLGLGNEAGSKLDGDEQWQDQELQEILEWLQLVHFATGVAGEALLGLVYVVGVCGVVGRKRTIEMLDDIIHINLEPLRDLKAPEWVCRALMGTCLTLIGLVLGTYLLFYSWIWACLLWHFCYRILNVPVDASHTPSSQ